MNYQQTVDAVTTGAYQDWSIASTSEADDFIDSFLEGANPCSNNGTADDYVLCSNDAGYNDGDFGDNFAAGLDYFWFLNDEINSINGIIVIAGFYIFFPPTRSRHSTRMVFP